MPTTGGLEEPVDEVLSMAGKPEEGHPVAEIVAKDLMNESLKTEGTEVHMREGWVYGTTEPSASFINVALCLQMKNVIRGTIKVDLSANISL